MLRSRRWIKRARWSTILFGVFSIGMAVLSMSFRR